MSSVQQPATPTEAAGCSAQLWQQDSRWSPTGLQRPNGAYVGGRAILRCDPPPLVQGAQLSAPQQLLSSLKPVDMLADPNAKDPLIGKLLVYGEPCDCCRNLTGASKNPLRHASHSCIRSITKG